MKHRMGENIAREWAVDDHGDEVWDAVASLKNGNKLGIVELEEIAKNESSLALLYLGTIYLYGEHKIEKNEQLGEKFLRKSMKKGSIEGAYHLASQLLDSDRFLDAIDIYRHLSKLDYSPAQYSLGYIYAVGDKLPKDNKLAMHYFTLASKNGHFPSISWKSRILMKELGGALNWIHGFLILIIYTIPFVILSATYPSSDRLRR